MHALFIFLIAFAGVESSYGEISGAKISASEDLIPLIIFYKDVQAIELIKRNGKVIHEYNLVNAVSAKIPANKIEKLFESPSIERIYHDHVIQLGSVECGGAKHPIGLEIIGAKHAWEMGYTGSGIKVAVIDSGIDYNHPDLKDNYAGGYDFVNDDSDPMDDNGHGTHVAGIIAANGSIKGVAPGASLLAVKVLDAEGSGYASDIIAGIDWAVANGTDVISISLGGILYPDLSPNDEFASPVTIAADAAVEKGVVVVVAAGNEGPGTGTVSAPGCGKNVITVGASDDGGTLDISDDRVANFSNRGPSAFGRLDPELVAPGVDITSTYLHSDYCSMSGTSMAAPHVAGAAALLLQKNPSLNPKEIRSILMHTSSNINAHVFEQGSGIINVTNALTFNTTASINGKDRWEISAIPGLEITAQLTLNNKNDVEINYSLSIGPIRDLEGDNSLSKSCFELPSSVVVKPNSKKMVEIKFSCIGNASIYGTILEISGNFETLRIPIVVTVPLVEDGLIKGTVNDNYDQHDPKLGDFIYYKIKSHNATFLRARLSWEKSDDDLDLFLFAPNGVLVNYSGAGNTTYEELTAEIIYEEYWLVVHNYNSSGIPYNLSVKYDSKLQVLPPAVDVSVGRGEVKKIVFTVINDEENRSVSLGVNRLSSKKDFYTGIAPIGFSVPWFTSYPTRYISAVLEWSNPSVDLDLYIVYHNGTDWVPTRFVSLHDNAILKEAKEEITRADVLHYIKKYGKVGIGVHALAKQAFNLSITTIDEVPWDAAELDKKELNLSSKESKKVEILIHTLHLLNKTYDALFTISDKTGRLASVPIRLNLLSLIVNRSPSNVQGIGYYSTIQQAIDANVGIPIVVLEGEYEENLDINAGVRIVSFSGPDYTKIKSDDAQKPVIKITGEGSVSGFTILGSKNAGIYVEAGDSTITNNYFLNNSYGIVLNQSKGVISNNRFLGSDFWDVEILNSSSILFGNFFNQTNASIEGNNIRISSVTSSPYRPKNLLGLEKYINISSISGWAFLNISYTDDELGRITESTLKIYRYKHEWEELNSSVNMKEDYVYVNITNFSIFGVFGRDETPPRISNVRAASITTSSAVISWNTNEDCDSVVKYGTRPGNYQFTKRESSNVTSHRIELSGLNPGTKYYFVVNSTDIAGNSNQSPEHSFSTRVVVATGGVPSKWMVLLANSIDYNLSKNFTAFLKGINIIYTSPENFSKYKNRRFIVILGGPDAYEGVGEIVQEVLNRSEQDYLRIKGHRKMYVKTGVWTKRQVVIVIAGSDREQTMLAGNENKLAVKIKLRLY